MVPRSLSTNLTGGVESCGRQRYIVQERDQRKIEKEKHREIRATTLPRSRETERKKERKRDTVNTWGPRC